jgi:hypothetical protein
MSLDDDRRIGGSGYVEVRGALWVLNDLVGASWLPPAKAAEVLGSEGEENLCQRKRDQLLPSTLLTV